MKVKELIETLKNRDQNAEIHIDVGLPDTIPLSPLMVYIDRTYLLLLGEPYSTEQLIKAYKGRPMPKTVNEPCPYCEFSTTFIARSCPECGKGW